MPCVLRWILVVGQNHFFVMYLRYVESGGTMHDLIVYYLCISDISSRRLINRLSFMEIHHKLDINIY